MSERSGVCKAIKIASVRFGSSEGLNPFPSRDFKFFETQASEICTTISGFLNRPGNPGRFKADPCAAIEKERLPRAKYSSSWTISLT